MSNYSESQNNLFAVQSWTILQTRRDDEEVERSLRRGSIPSRNRPKS